MIIETRRGQDIWNGGNTRIAFAANIEGYNDAGFAGSVAANYWPELADAGKCELGTVMKKEVKGITFYALVCHSLRDGWKMQTETIKKCFDKIDGDEPVASIAIGTGMIGILSGADFSQIKAGMEASKTKIILY